MCVTGTKQLWLCCPMPAEGQWAMLQFCAWKAAESMTHSNHLSASRRACEEPQTVLMRKLTEKQCRMAPQKRRAEEVRCWMMMMKGLPAPMGWPHNDRMAKQRKDFHFHLCSQSLSQVNKYNI